MRSGTELSQFLRVFLLTLGTYKRGLHRKEGCIDGKLFCKA